MNTFCANSDSISFTPENRYARQVVLPEIGASGQQKLLGSSVLIIGCGALGCIQAELLTRAGIGTLVIADRDVPTMHNLQRQFLFDEDDVAAKLPKAVAAAKKLRRVNSQIVINEMVMDVTADNIEQLIKTADIILDGTDNFETRFIINDACIKQNKPWVYGGVQGTTGTALTVRPGSGPCFRCLLDQPPDPLSLPTCDTHGVLNTVVVWVASLQVTETFKCLLGCDTTRHFLNTFDLWRGVFRAVPIKRNPICPCCEKRLFAYLEIDIKSRTTVLCGRNSVQISPSKPMSIPLDALSEKLQRVGQISANGSVMELKVDGYRMIIFPDGRVIVAGTKDTAIARNLMAKYLGN